MSFLLLSELAPSPLPLPQDYIAVKEKYAKYLPHSAGRYAAKRFRKAQCPIVERLTNSMMMHGRNNGKKLMTVRIVKHAFEIIHLLTGEVGPRARRGEYPEAPDANSTPAIGMPGPSRDGEGRGLGVRLMHVPLCPPEPPAGPGERHHQQRPPGGLHPHWASWNSEAAGRGRVPTAPCESGGLGAFGHTWALRNGHQAGSECCLGQRLATGDVHLCMFYLSVISSRKPPRVPTLQSAPVPRPLLVTVWLKGPLYLGV